MSKVQKGPRSRMRLISDVMNKGCASELINKSVPAKHAKRMLWRVLSSFLVATAMIIIEFKGTAIMAEIELTQMTATRFS